MTVYHACVALHLLAMATWLGHMFIWSIFAGPSAKALKPVEDGQVLREASLSTGGLGWPALATLVLTGGYLLAHRGITIESLLSGMAFAGPLGKVLAVKLSAVAAMVIYQSVYAHRPAKLAVHANMMVALVILGCSVLLVRGLP
ncbi:MAG: hypothetical protein ACO3K0_08935 [Steroidobacteraceae bacterium]